MSVNRKVDQTLKEGAAFSSRADPLRVIVLVASDLFALLVAGMIAYMSWAYPVRGQAIDLYLQLFPLLSVFIATYYLLGLYPGQGLGGVELLRRLSLGTLLCFAFLAAGTFALKLPPLYSRVTFAIALVTALFLVPLFRLCTLSICRKSDWWYKPVVLVTTSPQAESTGQSLLRAAHLGYRTVGVLTPGECLSERMVAGIPVLGNLGDAPEVARLGIHTAILEARAEEFPQILELLRHDFRYLVTIRSYSEVGVERVQIRSLGEILGLEYTNSLLIPRNRYTKRFVDLSLGVPLFLVSLPVVVISLAAVKVRSPGKGMFYQVREGLGGKSFRMPKIRTMVPNAEAELKDRLTGDTELNDNWNRRYKLIDDPRVIPGVGTFLRRFSIDELPQLWSVVKGDMSLVGPRPLPEYHLAALSDDGRRVREEVRPGITGLWQIRDRGTLDIVEQEARDSYYVRNWTVWLDLYVIGRTIGAVITGRGAH